MTNKRRTSDDLVAERDYEKSQKLEDVAVQKKREETIRKARERITQLRQAQQQPKEDPKTEARSSTLAFEGRGLNVELHPLLSGRPSSPVQSDANPNLTKRNKRGFAINPYLEDVTTARPRRDLKFNEPGKYIEQANEIRKQERLADLKKKIEATTRKAGLEADLSLREDQYKVQRPPQVEWWDKPFVLEDNYEKINIDAVSIYIAHPVPINAPWERHLPPSKPLYLTKKEMKRMRRIDRAEKYKEQQDKIKLGLEPAPPPKVKLSNLMNALTNEAIQDPTAVERRVRKEVEERKQKHNEENESRKLTKEERHVKIEEKYERDLQKGFYTAVFIVNKLEHPSHKFKVDKNAEQLSLVGTLLYVSDFVLVIVEGSEKNIKFYKKLMTKRIKWDESTIVDGEQLDLSKNKCELLWEGQLKEQHFKKWSIFRADDEDTALSFLTRFGVDNYYREAKAKKVQSAKQ